MKIFSIKPILIAFFTLIFCFFISNLQAKEILKIEEEEIILGDPNAPITMIEYASMSCPHCASFHLNTLPAIKEEYIDTGKVKFVFRDYPFNLPALQASMIIRCVGENVYFKYINALFGLQKKWVKSKGSAEKLFEIMNNSGMTQKEFNNCLNDKDMENKILSGQLEAQKQLNIRTTPSFIVNGKKLEGNKPIDTFRNIFESILEKSI